MNFTSSTEPQDSINIGMPMRDDPRAVMADRLPGWVQPFLTWLTARPAPGEDARATTPIAYVWSAVALTIGGCIGSALAVHWIAAGGLGWPMLLAALMLTGGLVATTSGLGLFQVVVFHHCAHGTVFRDRARNRNVGRLVSALLLFKHFDNYQREHMLHHNANKLFTDDDEFTDFVVGICDLAPTLQRHQLWRRLIINLVSPRFHGRFLFKRMLGSMNSHERGHNLLSFGGLAGLLLAGLLTHSLGTIVVAWLLPLTVLLQIATVFRILCEHRMPAAQVIAERGKVFVCQATAGVFPGASPPVAGRADGGRGRVLAWALWWANMLTVQLWVRLFVLVGDAPCHDFHHRRPASKRWPQYIHARQNDLDAGCPGFPLNYGESWGLFRAIDENFAAMARVAAPAREMEESHPRALMADLVPTRAGNFQLAG